MPARQLTPVSSTGPPASEARIGLVEWGFTSSARALVAGPVVLEVTNAGSTPHDMQVRVGDEVVAATPVLRPGESQTLRADLTGVSGGGSNALHASGAPVAGHGGGDRGARGHDLIEGEEPRMTTDADESRPGPSAPRGRTEASEDRYPWPPSATTVWLFIVLVFMLGGPATWWAVTR